MPASNPTGLRAKPAKRMAPYHRTEGIRPAVHPDGIVTKPNTYTSDMQKTMGGEGSGSLSKSSSTMRSGAAKQSPLGGKKQVVDTGAKDQVEIHNRNKRKLGSTNSKYTIKQKTSKGNL
jgi:hypothetical protein